MAKKMTRSTIREHIFKIVFSEPFRQGEDFDAVIDDYFNMIPDGEEIKDEFCDEDKEYIIAKARDIFNHLDEIDSQVSDKSNNWAISRIGKAELAILRLAVYEIVYDQSIPDNVAINEAVELSHTYGDISAPSFINGILASVKG